MNKMAERIYAGFIGMNAGIRLGAPVEPTAWDFSQIARFYGDIRGYVKNYKNFAADDDVNGPVYFLRGLLDNGIKNKLTAAAVGEAWLNYAREGIGLYWWGGDGISTEHTAYNNLKRGIPAPLSGSAEQNGIVLAEQIGGQIFIDTWGLINLGDPENAAAAATCAASVSHDGNGLYGAAFMAACIAAAYTADSIDKVIDAGLEQIPSDCTYAAVVNAVRDFHRENPSDWRGCMQFLIDNWGYDKYGGVCHIIPNAGVCALAMLYGAGDFSRTIEIATMCGWDTDCNAGNIGTVLGVFCGLEGIPAHYRAPINDFIVLSGVSGYLNNLDVPTYCKFLYQLSRLIHGKEEDPEVLLPNGGELLFDFALSGSSHGLRLSNELRFMKHFTENGLQIVVDRVLPADNCDIYYKPFYRRSDFDDERYKPVFSPTVYSGQVLRCRLCTHFFIDGSLLVTPYVKTAVRNERYDGKSCLLKEGEETELVFRVPDTCGDCVSEIGFHIEAAKDTVSRVFAVLDLKEFTVTGKGCYHISTSLCKQEFLQQTPFSLNHGKWHTEGGALFCETEEPAQAYTGNYYATDVAIASDMRADTGSCLMLRAAGTRRYTSAGFIKPGKVGFKVHNAGSFTELLADFDWKPGQTYNVQAVICKNAAQLLIDGAVVASAELDGVSPYGMVGFALENAGTASWLDLHVCESGDFVPLIPQ